MNAKLPPPDPYESLGMQPRTDTVIAAPTAVFPEGRPSAQTDRVSDALLDMRPGLRLVIAAS
jgi:hypothetical protein